PVARFDMTAAPRSEEIEPLALGAFPILDELEIRERATDEVARGIAQQLAQPWVHLEHHTFEADVGDADAGFVEGRPQARLLAQLVVAHAPAAVDRGERRSAPQQDQQGRRRSAELIGEPLAPE